MSDETQAGEDNGAVVEATEAKETRAGGTLPPPVSTAAERRPAYRRIATQPVTGWRKKFTWTRVIVWGWIAVAVFLFVRWVIPHNVDEGFIRFQPDASLFPAAPVDDAETLVGIGTPVSWATGPDFCPYSSYTYYGWETARGRAWHTVRHDWEEDGEAKAWVISESTFAFGDVEEGENYIDGVRNRLTYCGWEYAGGLGDGFNAIITDLDGLPKDSYAFVVDASPTNERDPGDPESFDPDDFEGLGVVMPAHKPGHMVFVTWTGWATGVPTDEFVATANRIYDAAIEASDPDDAFKKDDTTIDFDSFHEFEPDESRVKSLIGGKQDWMSSELESRECDMDWYQTVKGYLSPDSVRPRETYVLRSEQRSVEFTSVRFEERWRYLSARDRVNQVVTPLCVDTRQRPRVLIEPITVPDGLPGGTTAAVWHDDDRGDTYALVLTDDERQLMMVIAWNEQGDELPEPLFVEVANTAWTELRDANP